MIFNLFGKKDSDKKKVFKFYNGGVSFSLKAGELLEIGRQEEAEKMNLKAIEKYKKAVQIDNCHKPSISALGFAFFEIRRFDEAIIWFENAIEIDPEFAVNHQFLGLSRINKGQVDEGDKNFNRAFELDNSQEIRSITIENLVEIGNLACSFADGYDKEEEFEKGDHYRRFGVRVLISAMNFSDNDKEIGKIIQRIAPKINEEGLTNYIKRIMK